MRIIIEIPPEDVVAMQAGAAKIVADAQAELAKAALEQLTRSLASGVFNPWAMFLPK